MTAPQSRYQARSASDTRSGAGFLERLYDPLELLVEIAEDFGVSCVGPYGPNYLTGGGGYNFTPMSAAA